MLLLTDTVALAQAADGETDKQSARCKKILPAGALRIKWPADVDFEEDESFGWLVLKPSSFNKDIHLGWRFAACEIERLEAANAASTSRQDSAKKKGKGRSSSQA